MPLKNCPDCGRQVSKRAEVCPQCGHQIRKRARSAAGPSCYACSAAATTLCQRCGVKSCVTHLAVSTEREILCNTCYPKASAGLTYRLCVALIVVLFNLSAILYLFLRRKG